MYSFKGHNFEIKKDIPKIYLNHHAFHSYNLWKNEYIFYYCKVCHLCFITCELINASYTLCLKNKAFILQKKENILSCNEVIIESIIK